jgi:hypothetical protein
MYRLLSSLSTLFRIQLSMKSSWQAWQPAGNPDRTGRVSGLVRSLYFLSPDRPGRAHPLQNPDQTGPCRSLVVDNPRAGREWLLISVLRLYSLSTIFVEQSSITLYSLSLNIILYRSKRT